MSDVVKLSGEPLEAPPDENIVYALKALLDAAESGHILALQVAHVDRNDFAHWRTVGDLSPALIGASFASLTAAATDLHNSSCERDS